MCELSLEECSEVWTRGIKQRYKLSTVNKTNNDLLKTFLFYSYEEMTQSARSKHRKQLFLIQDVFTFHIFAAFTQK